MYHPNYPPQMPNQPLGYPPVSSHHGPPQHIPNPQQLPPNHQMPFHTQPNQMPGSMIPPPPHSVNSQLNQTLPPQQMIPPNYSPMQHTDKLQQQQKAQQQLTAANIKQQQQQQQQNQMYMRPPNLMQSSGKPASYQQNAYPMPPGHPNSHMNPMMQSHPYPTHPYSMHHGSPHQQVDLQYHQQMNDFMRPPINNQYPNHYPPPPPPQQQQQQQNGTPFKYKYPQQVDNRLNNQNLNTSLNSSQQSDLSQTDKTNTDERSETPKKPLNPPLIGSPAASMSSFHGDELDNNSTASPRTPASPAVAENTSLHTKNSKKNDIFAKLYDLGNEPDRKTFLDKLSALNESRIALNKNKSKNQIQCPIVNSQPLDLYKLYNCVKERGGFVEVSTRKIWKEVFDLLFEASTPLNIAYGLKKHYMKYVLPYECKYDLNDIDPKEIMDRFDPPKDKKKSKKTSAPSPSAIDSNSQNSYPQAATPVSDNSNLSTSNSNSSNKQNISANGNQNRSATPNLSSANDKFNAPSSLNTQSSNNNLSAPTTPVSKQSKNFDPKLNQKHQQQQSTGTPIANNSSIPPNYPQNLNNSYNSNYIPPPGTSPMHQYRPNNQYPVPNASDANLIPPPPPAQQSHHPHSEAPINSNNLSHNNEFHYHSTAEHYQNMNRTHSPQLAQRLMQQKSQLPPSGYQPNSQPPFNVPQSPQQNMTPNKPTDQSNNFATPKRPPSIPPQNQIPSQMVYHHPNQPPQFNSPYHPNHPPYRHPYNYDANQPPPPPPNWINPNDPNYNKMPNLSAPMQHPQIPTSSPAYSTSQIPPPPPPQQSQLHLTPAGIPQPNKPQYLLNLLANSGSPTATTTTPSTQLPTTNLSQPPVPTTPSKLIPPSPQMPQPTTQIQQSQPIYHYGPVSQQIQPTTMHYLSNQYSQFPPDSIESVQPTFIKRRKMTAKDVNQIEAWRLMMSLKSGLLAESTWALDVLSILIHDDNTYLYFGLAKLPGLLDILLEYYKHYLTEIFKDLFKDDLALDEPKSSDKNNLKKPLNDKDFECETIKRMKKRFSNLRQEEDDNLMNSNKLNDNDSIDKELIKEEEKEFKQSILSPKNDYTFITRTGKEVKIKDDDNLFVSDFNKSWDIDDNQNFKTSTKSNLIESNRLYFSKGYGSITNYILQHFEVGESSIKFAKNLDEKYREYEEKKEQENQNKTNYLNDDNLYNNSSNNNNNNKENLINNDDNQQTNEYPRFRNDKRKLNNCDNYENEAYKQDQSPLCNLNDYNEAISRRCICISTLIRNISFVPGNEAELSKYKDLLFILGKLILLHHKHLEKKIKPKNENLKDLEENLFNEIDNTETTDELNNLTSSFNNNKLKSTTDYNLEYLKDSEWCWDTLHFIRENTLVTLANISGKLDLSKYAECISLNIFDGLLHWSVCDSSDAQDHLPSTSLEYLTPKRLAIETLAKLSILESNVDLILSTPPWNRIEKLFKYLSDQLSRDQEQTLREFALVLLHNLTISDSSIARAIALSSDCITQLINYVEFAEQRASEIINQNGFSHFKENPEMMGTTIDMVKRAATCLLCLARNIENRPLFFNYQQRLITLSISNILHPQITSIIADILYECSINEVSFDKFRQFNLLVEQKNN